MSIKQNWEKIKGQIDFTDFIEKRSFLVVLLILISSLSFGLGRLSGLRAVSKNITIDFPKGQSAGAYIGAYATTTPEVLLKTSGIYVASKTGTKFYLPACSSSKRIAVKNRVWFDSKEEAVSAGYSSASNCKGI